MASSTRSSLMPRARSWVSTIRWRRFTNAAVSSEEFMQSPGMCPVSPRLFLALPYADIEADHSVLIARAHHGDIAIEIIFALNDLLRTLRDVCAVGQRKIVGELLLDGHLRAPRGRIGFRGQPLGIDLDPADPEQLLHAVAHGRVERLADDQVCGLVCEQTLA